MSLSAVSALVALSLFRGGPDQELARAETRVWSKVRPSVVTIMNGLNPTGVGVCIDKKGYFIAHKSAVPFGILIAKLSFGPQIELRQVAVDEATQMVLLRAPNAPTAVLTETQIGAEPEKAGGPLLAVLASGPLKAVFVNGEKIGVVKPSQRVFPLNEIQFESTSFQIGGGLVFNMDGSLIGVLGATLGSSDNREYQSRNNAFGAKSQADATARGGFGGGGGRPTLSAPAVLNGPAQFGPAPQMIAYSISSSVLQRVASGLLSPSHKVVHPAIGVFCKDSAEPGAEIVNIQTGSPAEKAGLHAGDIIVAIGETPVRNSVDVGRITMRLRIGAAVEVKFKRAGQEQTVQVGIGTD
jgi:S1-C subfamily serine protease